MHKPIQIKSISFIVPHKSCFEEFTQQIFSGSRIALIGRNGVGKSTLLKILAGLAEPTDGKIEGIKELCIGYVPQIIDDYQSLSGGQKFNKTLSQALGQSPDVLMLDEPTNHLDSANRDSLIRMLRAFEGTLIMVTHDPELLRNTVDTLWHLNNEAINVFSGSYDDYLRECSQKSTSVEQELTAIQRQKKQMHEALMREQARAKKSRIKGETNIHQRKWPTVVSSTKMRNAQETSGRKKSALDTKKQVLISRLAELRQPEILKPKFNLSATNSKSTLVSISNGAIGYSEKHLIVSGISLTVKAQERIAIAGPNGCGKTTLIKAVLQNQSVIKSGNWLLPNPEDIGYLDQQYSTLDPDKSVFETISCLNQHQSYIEIRTHLNDFLFRKNEEVEALVATLSGGEKARLSLAQIAAKTPKLLILDEITNNLDNETREHVLQVLSAYPGAMMIISHDEDFLSAISVTEYFYPSHE